MASPTSTEGSSICSSLLAPFPLSSIASPILVARDASASAPQLSLSHGTAALRELLSRVAEDTTEIAASDTIERGTDNNVKSRNKAEEEAEIALVNDGAESTRERDMIRLLSEQAKRIKELEVSQHISLGAMADNLQAEVREHTGGRPPAKKVKAEVIDLTNDD